MTTFKLEFTEDAANQLKALENDGGLRKRLNAVRKALGYLQSNPRHPGLNSHAYSSLQGRNGEKVFEVYAENKTPAAYRIFWHYDRVRQGIIHILAITPHP